MYKVITINNEGETTRIVSPEQLREENKPISEIEKLKAENEQLKKANQILEQEIETYKQLVDVLINESDEGVNEV